MKLIVWNSQGAKWDICWNHYIQPVSTSGDGVIALLLEAGWAPWVKPGAIEGNLYTIANGMTWYDEKGAGKSTFCQGIVGNRHRSGFWVPWVRTIDTTHINARCSLGGAWVRPSSLHPSLHAIDAGLTRPVIVVTLDKVGSGFVTTKFTIVVAHMISGLGTAAQAELNLLMKVLIERIPQETSAIIVGDMNINLLKAGGTLALPKGWRFLNTGVATQQSGGELDYGILYDPNNLLTKSTAQVLAKYKTVNNPSDHSVMGYDIPLSKLG